MIEENSRTFPKNHIPKSQSQQPDPPKKQPKSIQQIASKQLIQDYQDDLMTTTTTTYEFKQYIQNFDQTIQKANYNQLESLRKKYRFYLSKVQKLQQIKNNLQQKYNSIEEYIENSLPIKDLKQSIRFIQMISKQAQKKSIILTEKVNKAKQLKKGYNKKIVQLKQVIKKQKDLFFDLKRISVNIRQDFQAMEKASKLQSANSTFKNIVNNKIIKIKQKQKIEGISQFNQSQRIKQISSRISNIDLIRKQYMSKQSKYGPNRLPGIVQNLTSIHNKGKFHQRRQSCVTDLYLSNVQTQIHGQQDKRSQNDCKNYMSYSSAFTEMKSGINNGLLEGSHCHKLKLTLNSNNTSNKNKNRNLLNQLDKISKMKQQLLSYTEKVKREFQNNVKTTKKYQSYKHISTQNDKILTNSAQINNNQNPNTEVKQNIKQKCKHNEQNIKNCNACSYNQQRDKLLKQKYSLHEHQIKKLKKKFDCQNYDQQILISKQQQDKANNLQKQKQLFYKLKPQDIIKQIVRKGKIGQIIKLLQKQNVCSNNNNNKNSSFIKILR